MDTNLFGLPTELFAQYERIARRSAQLRQTLLTLVQQDDAAGRDALMRLDQEVTKPLEGAVLLLEGLERARVLSECEGILAQLEATAPRVKNQFELAAERKQAAEALERFNWSQELEQRAEAYQRYRRVQAKYGPVVDD
jgi:hypothetical protein